MHQQDDVVRSEIEALLQRRSAIFPLLVEGARLPDASELPDTLTPLLRFQATAIDNGGWGTTMSLLIREIESVIRDHEPARGSEAGGSTNTLSTRIERTGRLDI